MASLLSSTATFCATLLTAIAAHGYHAFPIPRGTKGTFWENWTRWCRTLPTAEEIAQWVERYPAYGIAIACGHACFAIDIDEEDEVRVAFLKALVFSILGETPLVRIGRAPRCVLIYRNADPRPVPSCRFTDKIELIGDGRYVVAHNIHPVTKRPYEWPNGRPEEISLDAVPAPGPDQITALKEALRPATRPPEDGTRSALPDTGVPTTGVKPGPARTAQNGLRWEIGADGKVHDGRDSYLTQLIAIAYARGHSTPDAITDHVWDEFKATADLARPKRDGSRSWSRADALKKAERIVCNPRLRRGGMSAGLNENGPWNATRLAAFNATVDARGALGHLPPSAIRVSHAMSGYLHGGGPCFASPTTLAVALGLAVRTVKQGRQRLVQAGLWLVTDNRGGQARGAHYRPNPAVLPPHLQEDETAVPSQNGEQSGHPKPVKGGNTYQDQEQETQDADEARRKDGALDNLNTLLKQSNLTLGRSGEKPASPKCRGIDRPGALSPVAAVPREASTAMQPSSRRPA